MLRCFFADCVNERAIRICCTSAPVQRWRRKVSVTIAGGWIKDRVFLRFGAVFHIATVWVNGACVGSHVGGFLPFSFDVTEHLAAGRGRERRQEPGDGLPRVGVELRRLVARPSFREAADDGIAHRRLHVSLEGQD